MNPHGSIGVQLGKNQAEAILSVMSRGIDEIEIELEDSNYNAELIAERKLTLSSASTAYSKIHNAMKQKGWVDE